MLAARYKLRHITEMADGWQGKSLKDKGERIKDKLRAKGKGIKDKTITCP